jgi:polyvinyl alcohol dehydrogenase (cytochrome)
MDMRVALRAHQAALGLMIVAALQLCHPVLAAANGQCASTQHPYPGTFKAPHWNGWGVDVTQRRFQPADQARLTAAQVPRLKLKWAFGFADSQSASGQPSIVDGRVFVGNSNRKVYALSAATGCTYWTFEAEFPVRTAISVGPFGKTTAVYFGDQHASAYAVDATSGRLLWKTQVNDFPVAMITGAPTLAGGVLYVPVASLEDAVGADPKYECCKFRGSVTALDAQTGKVLWKASTVAEDLQPRTKNALGVQLWGPAGAGVWSSPTVDLKRQRIYVTTSNATSDPIAKTSDAFVAFDLKSGRLLWSQQMTAGDGYNLGCDLPPPYRTNCPAENGPDFDFGSSAMLIDLPDGHRALVAGQKSGMVHAIDPDAQGRLLWQKRVGHGGRLGGVQWGSATDGHRVYVALSDAQLTAAQPGTPGAQAALGTAFVFDPKVGGGLFALDVRTGETLWHTPHPGCNDKPGCSPGQSAAVTAIPGVVFSGGIDGHLRAYDSTDGRMIWDMDTMHEFTTVNGVAARGGSLNGPGGVVVGGMLYINSGYVHLGTTPGNVLLAFSVDGR